MFKLIGGDGKEYGPIPADTLRDWLRQGRVNGSTRVLPEGAADWVELRALQDFQADLAAERPPLPRPTDTTTAAAAAPTVAVAGEKVPRSGLATASLVLGILGFLTFGVTALIGLVLGIVALVKINGSQGRVGGKGLATAGIVTSGVALVFVPIIAILAALLLPALAQAKGKAQQVQCMNHLKQIVLGVRMYASDNKEVFPAATNWCDALTPYVSPGGGGPGGQASVFACPVKPGQRCTYAYNPRLSGLEEGKVNPRTVVIFESDLGWNGAGGPEAVATRHQQDKVCVAFADGRVEVVPAAKLPNLRWNP
jgi:hypothetical protein